MIKKNITAGFVRLALLPLLAVLPSCTGDDTGMEITIGTWEQDYNVNTFVPKNDNEEKILTRRKQIMKDNDFTIVQKQIGMWTEIQSIAVNSIMAGQPSASVFHLQPGWAMSMLNRGVLYPISDSNAVDFSPKIPGDGRPDWNQSVREAFTFNGKTYAMSSFGGTRIALFYNKRVFKEAGLDP
jgi:ABC-type glycerol-3-phosphate transport system substrate-binding protein